MYDERHVADLLSSGGQQTFYTPPAQNMEVDKDSLVNPTIEVHPPQVRAQDGEQAFTGECVLAHPPLPDVGQDLCNLSNALYM